MIDVAKKNRFLWNLLFLILKYHVRAIFKNTVIKHGTVTGSVAVKSCTKLNYFAFLSHVFNSDFPNGIYQYRGKVIKRRILHLVYVDLAHKLTANSCVCPQDGICSKIYRNSNLWQSRAKYSHRKKLQAVHFQNGCYSSTKTVWKPQVNFRIEVRLFRVLMRTT